MGGNMSWGKFLLALLVLLVFVGVLENQYPQAATALVGLILLGIVVKHPTLLPQLSKLFKG